MSTAITPRSAKRVAIVIDEAAKDALHNGENAHGKGSLGSFRTRIAPGMFGQQAASSGAGRPRGLAILGGAAMGVFPTG